jgi:hypothetical protein
MDLSINQINNPSTSSRHISVKFLDATNFEWFLAESLDRANACHSGTQIRRVRNMILNRGGADFAFV